jgi:hypothetical protein
MHKVLENLDDIHMDVVTALHFHPVRSSICVSASDDGLLAVFDFSHGINEDEAFVVCFRLACAHRFPIITTERMHDVTMAKTCGSLCFGTYPGHNQAISRLFHCMPPARAYVRRQQ